MNQVEASPKRRLWLALGSWVLGNRRLASSLLVDMLEPPVPVLQSLRTVSGLAGGNGDVSAARANEPHKSDTDVIPAEGALDVLEAIYASARLFPEASTVMPVG